MIYKPRMPDTNPHAYGNYRRAAEAVSDPAADPQKWTNFLSGPRLPPGLALSIALFVSVVLWAGLFGIIHFL